MESRTLDESMRSVVTNLVIGGSWAAVRVRAVPAG